MFVEYFRTPAVTAAVAGEVYPERKRFTAADFKRAGLAEMATMPILEAYQTINRLNTAEAARKTGPRYVYHL